MNAQYMAAIVLLCFALPLVGTGLIRRLALRHGVLDVPNRRSSHKTPTPRGGGVAIVVAVTAAAVLLALEGSMPWTYSLALAVGGGAVAIVGLLDDKREVPARVRFGVHTAATILVIYLIGSLPPQPVGAVSIDLGWLGAILTAIGILWMLNLFNFMDGIDGLAASEAAFACGAAAAIAAWNGAPPGLLVLLGGICLANIGFLFWNWPPAKIFMGDVGSGFTGFAIGTVALISIHMSVLTIWTWIILCSLFAADATVTLIRRTVTGERWYQAHRSHAYQWLARRWGSHAKVTLTYTAINFALLLPLAVASVWLPDWSAFMATASLAFSSALALISGAGRSESPGEAGI